MSAVAWPMNMAQHVAPTIMLSMVSQMSDMLSGACLPYPMHNMWLMALKRAKEQSSLHESFCRERGREGQQTKKKNKLGTSNVWLVKEIQDKREKPRLIHAYFPILLKIFELERGGEEWHEFKNHLFHCWHYHLHWAPSRSVNEEPVQLPAPVCL